MEEQLIQLPDGTYSAVACLACEEPFEGMTGPDVLNHKFPCPKCGGQNYKVWIVVNDSIAVADDRTEFEVSTPTGVSVADRWTNINNTLTDLVSPKAGQPDSTAERDRLHHVYIGLWALFEACKREGIAEVFAKHAIASSMDIAYAMDLGNAAKHGTPLRWVWSGQQPSFGDFKMIGADDLWTVDETVLFDGSSMSGVAVARAATARWHQLLNGWGLL